MWYKKLATWFGSPIEVRVSEMPEVKTDFYISVENNIKQVVADLLEREGTEINWQSNGKDVIIRNKFSGVRIYISLTKQRIMWESSQSTDTIPTTQTFIESLFEDVKTFQNKLFDVLREDILDKRQNRLSNMSEEIIKQKVLDISTII